jgi:hypothetical protein
MKTLAVQQRGMITMDFIFAMVLILGLSGLLFVVAFSLSMASVTQYITFAAARNFMAAHQDIGAQTDRATQKYKELVEHPVLKTLFTNGWYTLSEEPTVGDHVDQAEGFQEAAATSFNKFWGVSTTFTAKVLAFNIPFFGSTVPDGDGSGDGFTALMGSYLGREPTSQECLAFNAARWTRIRSFAGTGAGVPAGQYFPMSDDGC